MMSIGALLETEIEEKLEKLATMEPGTDEYKVASGSVMKLLDRAIEMDKIDADRLEREQIRNDERVTKQESAKDEKRSRLIDKVIMASGIVIPAVVTVWGTNKSLKFEETGTVTTIMGRGFINKLLPKK